jgi:hypothetical protein
MSRTMPRPLLIMVFALAVMAMTLAPLARTANAEPNLPCSATQNAGRTVISGGIIYTCIFVEGKGWRWIPFVGEGSTGNYVVRTHNTSPVIRSITTSGLGRFTGGGYANTYTDITTTSGARWYRPMAVKLKLLKFSDAADRWVTCRDTGWVHGGGNIWKLRLSANYYTQPECGNGWYSVDAGGLWWSTGLGKWLGGTVNSGSLYIAPCCVVPPTTPPNAPANTDALPSGPNFANPTLPEGVSVSEDSS